MQEYAAEELISLGSGRATVIAQILHKVSENKICQKIFVGFFYVEKIMQSLIKMFETEN